MLLELVTDAKYPIEAIGQLYRDRADCRVCKARGSDELKNQWGLSGFTTCMSRQLRSS